MGFGVPWLGRFCQGLGCWGEGVLEVFEVPGWESPSKGWGARLGILDRDWGSRLGRSQWGLGCQAGEGRQSLG